MPNYHEAVPEGMQWLLAHVPLLRAVVPLLAVLDGGRGLLPMAGSTRAGPTGRARSASSTTSCASCSPGYRGAVRRPPRPARKGRARIPAGGQADHLDNGIWAATLQARERPAHHRTTSTKSPRGRRHGRRPGARGRRHHLGTGFQASKFLTPMKVVGPRRRRPERAAGRATPAPTSASRCRTSPTSSSCTARTRTSSSTGASSTSPSARPTTSSARSRCCSRASIAPWT